MKSDDNKTWALAASESLFVCNFDGEVDADNAHIQGEINQSSRRQSMMCAGESAGQGVLV